MRTTDEILAQINKEAKASLKLGKETPSARRLQIKEIEREKEAKAEKKAAELAAKKTREWKKTGRPLVVGFFIVSIITYTLFFTGHLGLGQLFFWGSMLAGLIWAMFQD